MSFPILTIQLFYDSMCHHLQITQNSLLTKCIPWTFSRLEGNINEEIDNVLCLVNFLNGKTFLTCILKNRTVSIRASDLSPFPGLTVPAFSQDPFWQKQGKYKMRKKPLKNKPTSTPLCTIDSGPIMWPFPELVWNPLELQLFPCNSSGHVRNIIDWLLSWVCCSRGKESNNIAFQGDCVWTYGSWVKNLNTTPGS